MFCDRKLVAVELPASYLESISGEPDAITTKSQLGPELIWRFLMTPKSDANNTMDAEFNEKSTTE